MSLWILLNYLIKYKRISCNVILVKYLIKSETVRYSVLVKYEFSILI